MSTAEQIDQANCDHYTASRASSAITSSSTIPNPVSTPPSSNGNMDGKKIAWASPEQTKRTDNEMASCVKMDIVDLDDSGMFACNFFYLSDESKVTIKITVLTFPLVERLTLNPDLRKHESLDY